MSFHTYLDTIRTAKKHKYTLIISNIAEMAILGSKMAIFGSFRMWIKNFENLYGLSRGFIHILELLEQQKKH